MRCEEQIYFYYIWHCWRNNKRQNVKGFLPQFPRWISTMLGRREAICKGCPRARVHRCILWDICWQVTHTHTHTHPRTHARTQARTHARTHTRARTHTHTHTHTRARTHLHTHTHRHAHTHIRADNATDMSPMSHRTPPPPPNEGLQTLSACG